MELWQIKLMINETPDVLLLLKWIEEQEFEDLRYLLSEMEKERDDAETNADKRYEELVNAEKERDDLQEKIDDIEELLDTDEATDPWELIEELKTLLGL